jgi:HSP20 family protein
MLMRFEPFHDIGRTTEEMLGEHRARLVPVDAYRRGNELKIELDMPGADPGSIELTVENDVLTTRATRTTFHEATDEMLVAERGFGQIGRQLFLGESLDREHISAIYHDGVLTITVPVAEQAKPRKIRVTHVGSVAQAAEATSITV